MKLEMKELVVFMWSDMVSHCFSLLVERYNIYAPLDEISCVCLILVMHHIASLFASYQS